MQVKEGYEGIFVALVMLAVALVLIGAVKWLIG